MDRLSDPSRLADGLGALDALGDRVPLAFDALRDNNTDRRPDPPIGDRVPLAFDALAS